MRWSIIARIGGSARGTLFLGVLLKAHLFRAARSDARIVKRAMNRPPGVMIGGLHSTSLNAAASM